MADVDTPLRGTADSPAPKRATMRVESPAVKHRELYRSCNDGDDNDYSPPIDADELDRRCLQWLRNMADQHATEADALRRGERCEATWYIPSFPVLEVVTSSGDLHRVTARFETRKEWVARTKTPMPDTLVDHSYWLAIYYQECKLTGYTAIYVDDIGSVARADIEKMLDGAQSYAWLD
jgi:hypothetical protein